jgi:CubicO group peptidase (beta-lactamase class C family)
MKESLFLKVLTVLLSSLLLMTQVHSKSLNLLLDAHSAMKPNTYTNIDSMLVYHKGKLISDNYYGRFTAQTTHRTHSTFKSINGLITLIAIDQGLLKIDDAVMPLLSRFGVPKEDDARKNDITVKHLLNMNSGISCNEGLDSNGPNHEWGVDEGPTPFQYSINIPMASAPGKSWFYCNANSFMLAAVVSAALERANRENIFQFAHKYLMAPLNIKSENYRFTKSQDGQFLNGQGNSHFLPEDLAKFGLLILNKGKWQNKSILSEHAVARIQASGSPINWSFTDTIQSNTEMKTTYSYQWYKTNFNVERRDIEVIHSWGNGGQFIFVIPSVQSVVVFTGSNQGNSVKQKQPFKIMHKYVLPELLKRESESI